MSGVARRASRGFGLVEMMVALTLGLLVVGGASVLFMATRQTTGSTDNLSRVQESVRTSYDLMTREAREAGGTPCDAQLLMANVLNNAQNPNPAWWAPWGEPVHGWDGATAAAGVAFGAGVGQRVAGTAALLVRYGAALDPLTITAHDSGTQTFTANQANLGFVSGDLLMVCNYKQGAIFQVSAVDTVNGTFAHPSGAGAPGNCSAGLGIPTVCNNPGSTYQFSSGSLVGRYTVSLWYIGNNGHPETGGRSLYRMTPRGAEEVADGVRDMQLGFLASGGPDYVAAAAVADWTQVMAVRFDLSFEGPDAGSSTTANGARMTRNVAYTVNLRNLQP